jgi:hypothetical protein
MIPHLRFCHAGWKSPRLNLGVRRIGGLSKEKNNTPKRVKTTHADHEIPYPPSGGWRLTVIDVCESVLRKRPISQSKMEA